MRIAASGVSIHMFGAPLEWIAREEPMPLACWRSPTPRASARRSVGAGPRTLVAGGSSAGGHLAALLGTTGDIKEFEGAGGVDPRKYSSRVQAVCDYYGAADLTGMVTRQRRDPDGSGENAAVALLGGPGPDLADRAKQASPVSYVSADDCPFLILHGEADAVVPVEQSRNLDRLLRERGVAVELHVIPNAGHGGREFNRAETWTVVRAFLDRHLK